MPQSVHRFSATDLSMDVFTQQQNTQPRAASLMRERLHGDQHELRLMLFVKRGFWENGEVPR